MAQIRGIRSKKHDRMCNAILKGLRNDGIIYMRDIDRHVYEKLMKEGLITRLNTGVYLLNMDRLRKVSYIVPDALWEKLGDINYQQELKGQDPKKAQMTLERRNALNREKLNVRKQNKGKKPLSNASFDLSDIVIGGSNGKNTI